jgi:hypothetical protein
MLTTAGDTRLMTGAKEGNAVCANVAGESASAANAAAAAKSLVMEQNLGGARSLTGTRLYKFRRARSLIFPCADALVNKLCVFCGFSLHTRCCVAQIFAPDWPAVPAWSETA